MIARFLTTAVLALSTTPAWADVEVGVGGIGGGAYWQPESTTARNSSFSPTASPIVTAQVDPWESSVRPVFGLASAPTFRYSLGYDAYSAPLVVLEAGLAFGSQTTRVTLGGHGGLWSFGAGARFTHLPLTLGPAARTGLELRASWLARWGGYAGAQWVIRFRPTA